MAIKSNWGATQVCCAPKLFPRVFLFVFAILLLPCAVFSQTPYHDTTFHPLEFRQPTSKAEWQRRSTQIRSTAKRLLGDIPPIPAHFEVQIRSKEQRDGYTLENFTFFNGVDATVFGIILIPNGLTKKAPAVLYNHYHGGEYQHGKDELFKKNWVNESGVGDSLVKEGYIVLAIDAYAFGERSGKGPNGPEEKNKDEELTWAKINLWKGRSFWGMIVRDDQMALSYLASRPEVDASRIATMGMSMGGFRSWWLGALDARIKVTIAAASITRNQSIMENGALKSHGIYYYVPQLLQHFDNESIMACIAPRPFLTLSGKDDRLAPMAGMQYINQQVEGVYRVMGKSEQFKHIEYEGVKHELTPQMWEEILIFLKSKL